MAEFQQLAPVEAPQTKEPEKVFADVQVKIEGLLEELSGMKREDAVDLVQLRPGEKAGVVVRAGDTDAFAKRVVGVVFERKSDGFDIEMSWRTLKEEMEFDSQGMPVLPDVLETVLLTPKQFSPLERGGKIRWLKQERKNSTEWTSWTIIEARNKPASFMGYAKTFVDSLDTLGSRIVLSETPGEVWTRMRAAPTVDLGELKKGKLIGPKPHKVHDLELPRLPFSDRVFGPSLKDERILLVGKVGPNF